MLDIFIFIFFNIIQVHAFEIRFFCILYFRMSCITNGFDNQIDQSNQSNCRFLTFMVRMGTPGLGDFA